MTNDVVADIAAVAFAILVLIPLANRAKIPYPIALVLGGIGLGYVPGLPAFSMSPDLVLVIFLPPLLYWESVTAPTSEFFTRAGLWWIGQLAFGLVIVTMIAVAAIAHQFIDGMSWAAAFVLGAIVASTDEVALSQVVERIPIPRHVVATIEGESLINDATSLVLYALAIRAVSSGSFSLSSAGLQLAYSVAGSIAIGIVAAILVGLAWRLTKDDHALQGVISLVAPYLAYLPAYYLGISGVLAVVATGIAVSRFTPRVLTPRARERSTGFWTSAVFIVNAVIFVVVGMQFKAILGSLSRFSPWQLLSYGIAVSLTVIGVRFVWVYFQGIFPASREPSDDGPEHWQHVTVLAWSGMRGGVSLAAAFAIPLFAGNAPFPDRHLMIYLTMCVLVATLVLQGGTLPLLMRALRIRDDQVDQREERVALAYTAKAALRRLDELKRTRDGVAPGVLASLRGRFSSRWAEFATTGRSDGTAVAPEQYRELLRELIEVQRNALLDLRNDRKIDNTVMRRIQRLLDLESEEIELLESSGNVDMEDA